MHVQGAGNFRKPTCRSNVAIELADSHSVTITRSFHTALNN